ncbi:MAG: hypothetical protein M3473_05370 [Chloroflexota bacterium]|jgi:hypothetical protein|nr:hypothetical protein [Chloroflexota bacterium]
MEGLGFLLIGVGLFIGFFAVMEARGPAQLVSAVPGIGLAAVLVVIGMLQL